MTQSEKYNIDIVKSLIAQRVKELKNDYKRQKEEAQNVNNCAEYRGYMQARAEATLYILNEYEINIKDIIEML